MDPLSIVRQWVAPYVGESGKSKDDPEVLEAINEARRIIYPVGDWKDTVKTIALKVNYGIITLPYWADVIRNAWNGIRPFQIDNGWFQPLGDDWMSLCGMECRYGLIDLGDSYASFKTADRPFRVKVVSQDNRDEGVKIHFHAISEHGEPVLLTRVLGRAWVPVVDGPNNDKWVKYFTYCEKPETQDRINVFIFDPVRKVETLCAIYEGKEVNPHYRRYRADGRRCSGFLIAKVKKKYKELTNDQELVDIHTDALIHLLQAVTARRNRDLPNYANHLAAAKNFLDREIQSSAPSQAHTIKMSPAYRDTNLGFEDCV